MADKETTKMVSFRIGVDQYTKLEQLRSAEGARSVSAMFRRAVDALLQDRAAKVTAKDEFALRLKQLEKKVDTLALHVGKTKSRGDVSP